MFNPFMLNTFPSLLDFSILAPFIIRIVVGVLFLRFGLYKISKNKSGEYISRFQKIGVGGAGVIVPIIGLVEIVASVALILGFLTQVSALILAIISLLVFLLIRYRGIKTNHSSDFYLLLMVVCLSLLLTGAGAFALDLPF
jgi:putative oxidoreductase